MSKIKKIRMIIEEINTVRQELAEETERINESWGTSEEAKQVLRSAMYEAAIERLSEIFESAESVIADIETLTEIQSAFDYSNPKLLAAAQFIQSNKTVPTAAWQQMISDFSKCPQELLYLSGLFAANKLHDAAIAAEEAAKEVSFSGGIPQRLSDKLYFVTHADPRAHIDLSGIERDLDALERAEANLQGRGAEDGADNEN